MDHRTDLHHAPTALLDQQSGTDDAVRTPARHRNSRRRPPSGMRRPGILLGAAAAGAVLVNVLVGAEPAAQARAAAGEPTSVASQLNLKAQSATSIVDDQLSDRLGELAATRSQREAEQDAATQVQAAADRAAIEAQQKAAAEAQAAADAQAAAEAKQAEAKQAEAKQAAAQQAATQQAATQQAAAQRAEGASKTAAAVPASSAASSGSYQDYALGQLGGDSGEFSCLENLWGKESGWNPKAQNRSSTAYGIPQFLDSTWAGTGIAKTSDGYRQIDAGLVYIDSRYGSPCGAWAHSRSTGWY